MERNVEVKSAAFLIFAYLGFGKQEGGQRESRRAWRAGLQRAPAFVTIPDSRGAASGIAAVAASAFNSITALVQPEASSHPVDGALASELASDKLY